MQQITNRFSKGLNKDINKINYPNDNYYHLQNGRVLSDTGNDGFSIVNVEGNSLEIDNLYPDFVIIGYCNIREDIVLFYANKDNSGAGKIILLKWFNEQFNPISIYENENLNLFESYPIKEDMVIGRYESPEIINVYWTDSFNKLRHLNIAPDYGKNGFNYNEYTNVRNTPISRLDVVSDIKFNTPTFESYTSGTLNSGMIQYAYRLYNINGSETIFSPASKLIPLTKYSDIYGTEKLRGQDTGGQSVETNTGKGVVIRIELDNETINQFDKIEIVSLWYSEKEGLPTISIIDQKELSNTIFVTDEGGEAEYGTLELEVFQSISNDFICKTLASKDDRLFVGNITEQSFDVEYDARSFRYHTDSTSTLYGESGIKKLTKDSVEDLWIESELDSGQEVYIGTYTNTGISYTTQNIPTDFDCINLYNVLDYENEVNPYIYKQDGSTYGGEGINVSYVFEDSICYRIDDNTSDVRTMNTSAISEDSGSISGLTKVGNKDWIRGSKRGFLRDEIYRFGISFFDKKGRSSFVKWIGDIRMPSNKEITSVISDSNGIYARPLYPKFTVTNIPSVDGEVLDYQIVYVKREKEDKTIISQGLGGGLIVPDNITHSNSFTVSTIDDYENNRYLDPGNDPINFNRELLEFISPTINFDSNFITSANNRLEIAGAIKLENAVGLDGVDNIWKPIQDTSQASIDDDFMHVRKYSDIFETDGTLETSNILELKVYNPSPENIKTTVNNLVYKHYVERLDIYQHASIRGTTAIIAIDTPFLGSFITNSNNYSFLFNIKNNVIGYNGNTFNDRKTNSYIPASELNNGYCYNGDIFICVYDYLRTIWDENAANNDRIQEVLYFPVETEYNLFYRYDDSYHRVKDLPNEVTSKINETGYINLLEGANFSELYLYDEVYSKVDNSKIYLPKPFNFSENNLFDCMIKYSDLKINSEERDSWLSFKPNNFNEVDSNYGELKTIINFSNLIFFFQERGFGVASINRQELTSSQVGTALVLGTGGILDRFDYISTEIGIQNQNKVIKSLQALYWLDNNKKKIYSYNRGLQSLDDLKGLNSWFEKGLSNLSVLTGLYDNKYSEVLFTVRNLEPIQDEITYFTKPECIIKFNNIVIGSKIELSLDNVGYIFLADSVNSGQLFKVEDNLSDSVDNLITAIESISNEYNIDKIDNLDGSYNLKITGIEDGLGNLNPKIESSKIALVNPASASQGEVGITVLDYSNRITQNSTFYVDCFAGYVPDKFEILKNGTNVPTNVVASTHISDTSILNGSNNKFDPDNSNTTPDDVSLEWFIGTANGIAPTGVSEFELDTGVYLPITTDTKPRQYWDGKITTETYQQRIWTDVNIGDNIYVRVSGGEGTGWDVSAGFISNESSNISIVSTTNIQKYSEIFTSYEQSSILEATGNGNLLQVRNPRYFNLRKGNSYDIENRTNTKIEDVDATQFVTDKSFSGNIDLSYYARYKDNYTVVYNEILQAFTGFYDFIPSQYIKSNRGFYTSIDKQVLFRHNIGNFCEFYGVVYDTYIDIIVSNNSSSIKEFNNIEYYSEIYQNGQIKDNESLYSIQAENDYQQSEEVILYPLSDDTDLENGEERTILYTEGNNIPTDSVNFLKLANIRRSVDHWRTAIPRQLEINPSFYLGDYKIEDYSEEDYYLYKQDSDLAVLNNYNRIRSPYLKLRLKFKNNEDKKFILHQVTTLFQQMIL